MNWATHLIYWGHGDNRFLNHGTTGIDMVNSDPRVTDHRQRRPRRGVHGLGPEQAIPAGDQAYYPDGIEEEFKYGPTTCSPRSA